ncbi:GlxA family transcriptional regulator [Arachidicoccus terrestris]|uniref:GlxA family transcriptional regulator n=1 Tax=Arachidicoccus terrestris TaxID=2875539 RepID=UPI001CC7A271|nr:helix-turn-helix domain-containing protein [Arachidicoccus terrestris]UAY54295.1 helix-turn-helix domain-containing protein [Arachidicoccus terrestris]
MKHISIIVPERAILASLEGSRQLFTQVNSFCLQNGQPPLFDVQLVGLQRDTKASGGLFTINASQLIGEVVRTDLIIIPAIDGDLQQTVQANAAFVPWIKKHYAAGAEVASLCLGAFLLAETGLLAGRKCATHWLATDEFKQLYPNADLVTEKIITEDKGIYCSGGAFSYLNLILYLIEKYAGRQMALLCAKVFAIEIDRRTQLPFTMFRGQKAHEDQPIKEAQDYIEENFRDKISIDQLCDLVALGRRSFERRFKKATHNTVLEYIQRVKIEAAKQQLELEEKNVSEVMFDVGYIDQKTFRQMFKKVTGLSPAAYKNKFRNFNLLAAVN